jgi:hypothetical protein
MWNMKFFVILVVTGVTGNGTKRTKIYLELLPGKHPNSFVTKENLLYLELCT